MCPARAGSEGQADPRLCPGAFCAHGYGRLQLRGEGLGPVQTPPRAAASGAVPQLPSTAAAASSPRVMTDDMLPPLGRRRGARGAEAGRGGRGGPPQEEELAPGGQGRVQPLVPATVASVSLSCQDPSPGGGGSPAGRAACQLPGVGATRRGGGGGAVGPPCFQEPVAAASGVWAFGPWCHAVGRRQLGQAPSSLAGTSCKRQAPPTRRGAPGGGGSGGRGWREAARPGGTCSPGTTY